MTSPRSTPAKRNSPPELSEFTARLVVRHRQRVADQIVTLDLADPDGVDLPKWRPGAHIEIVLGEGLHRHYSLCGDPHDVGTWRIAVLHTPNGRGGSQFVHEHLCEGATVTVRGPRNHFPLIASPSYLFIAGGIGITPMIPMIEEADRGGADWRLMYLGRERAAMAFQAELAARYGDRVTVWSDAERGKLFDLATMLAETQSHTVVYSCGPEPLLSAVEQHCGQWPTGRLHLERFAASTLASDNEEQRSFQVVCERSGVTVDVPADISMLEALEEADIPIMSSCLDGVCGTCRTDVLEGTPDHRDSLLSAAERDCGNVLLPCVSRSLTDTLVVDL